MTTKRAAHGHYLANDIGHLTCKFTRINTTETPTHQADLLTITLNQFGHPVTHAIMQFVAIAHVVAEFPPVRPVTQVGNILA